MKHHLTIDQIDLYLGFVEESLNALKEKPETADRKVEIESLTKHLDELLFIRLELTKDRDA